LVGTSVKWHLLDSFPRQRFRARSLGECCPKTEQEHRVLHSVFTPSDDLPLGLQRYNQASKGVVDDPLHSLLIVGAVLADFDFETFRKFLALGGCEPRIGKPS
jgi:hypothetical protein